MKFLSGLAAWCALLALASLACACSSCAPLGARGGRLVSIVSYNAMNLFDATDQGGEYPEFSVREGTWDDARYRIRLARLAEAVASSPYGARGPDVLCLVEIENQAVLEDLRSGPLKAGRYSSALMAPAEGSPVNCAILTRLPLRSLRSHAVAAGAGGSGGGRKLLEAELEVEGSPLVVLVCHWKSKIGGGASTEGARREAAALVRGILARRMAEGRSALVVCGDFNESPDEYYRVGRKYPTALMPAGEARALGGNPGLLVATDRAGSGWKEGETILYSPWGESEGFSYAFGGQKARIDGFLLSPGLLAGGQDRRPGAGQGSGLRYASFEVLDQAFLLDAKGQPRPWSSATASGYSDHLPILLVLETGGPG